MISAQRGPVASVAIVATSNGQSGNPQIKDAFWAGRCEDNSHVTPAKIQCSRIMPFFIA